MQVVLSMALGGFAQSIDLDGYQLTSERIGLVPVFNHDLRGRVRCEDANSARAKIDLIEVRHERAFVVPTIPTLHTESDEHGSFNIWVPRRRLDVCG